MFTEALYYFTKADEEEVSEALLRAFPALKFIDDQHWPSAKPPLAAGIHRCESTLVYLWPSDVAPKLPSWKLEPALRYDNIKYQGPSQGPVIQFCRCRTKHGQIEYGQLHASIERPDSRLGKRLKQIVAFLKQRYRCGLDCYSSLTGELLCANDRDFLVGKSIQDDLASAQRLVPYLGRDEYYVPTGTGRPRRH